MLVVIVATSNVTDVSREAGRAKYRVIADELRSAIRAGVYAPGDRLPGENALMQRYGVARMTARQALSALQNEGLTTTRKGSGVYVRDFRPIVRDGIKRLRRDIWAAGRGIWEAEDDDRVLTVDRIRVHETRASAQQSDALGLEADTAVIVRERRFVLDGRPVMLAISALPASIAAGTQIAHEDTGPGGTYARLADLGHSPAHFREDLRARMPTPAEADTLDLDGGTPVVEIARTAYTDNGTPVEFNSMTLDASVYILRYDFDA